MGDDDEVPRLLARLREGDRSALGALVPLVYQELRRRAAVQLANERVGHTLQPTAIVHEVFLRIAGRREIDVRDRRHFLAVASHAIRAVLVDHARARRAQKRGGAAITIIDATLPGETGDAPTDVLALHGALEELAGLDARQAQIVELRFFGGLTEEEIAEHVGVSASTVKREWRAARAFLRVRLRETT